MLYKKGASDIPRYFPQQKEENFEETFTKLTHKNWNKLDGPGKSVYYSIIVYSKWFDEPIRWREIRKIGTRIKESAERYENEKMRMKNSVERKYDS